MPEKALARQISSSQDLLSITSVHPMREEAVVELLRKADASWRVVEKLVGDGSLTEVKYQGKRFYMRKLHQHGTSSPVSKA